MLTDSVFARIINIYIIFNNIINFKLKCQD